MTTASLIPCPFPFRDNVLSFNFDVFMRELLAGFAVAALAAQKR